MDTTRGTKRAALRQPTPRLFVHPNAARAWQRPYTLGCPWDFLFWRSGIEHEEQEKEEEEEEEEEINQL